MPGHYRSPYGYSYFNPTGKEQAALTIGSLLAGALAASSGQSKGDAIRKGITGTMAGYGSGYQNYQNLMGDAFGRDLQTKSYGQRVKEHELSGEKFAEEKRQYEETEKPYKEAMTNLRNQPRDPNPPASVAEWQFGQNIQNPRQRSEFFNRTMPLKRDSEGRPWYQYTRDLETPEGTMAEVFDARKGTFGLSKPAGIGKPKVDPTLPAGEASDLGTLKELQGTIGNIKKIILDDKGKLIRGDLLGPIEGRTQEQLSKLVSNLDFIKLKHNTGQLRQIVYALSGKAINENELKWLNEKILPSIENQDDNYLVNLNEFNDWVGRKSQTQTEAFSKAGYRNMDKFKPTTTESPQAISQSMPKESVLQELFDLAQKGDPEALQYFKSKGIK